MTLRWVPGWNGLTEPEAVSYIAAVEAADGQDLEFGVARAINDFVLGCKNDGIWDAIKASCILAGARTLEGAFNSFIARQGTITAIGDAGSGGLTQMTIGNNSGGNQTSDLFGPMQELIIYPSDQSANRIAIEANINTHYSIF